MHGLLPSHRHGPHTESLTVPGPLQPHQPPPGPRLRQGDGRDRQDRPCRCPNARRTRCATPSRGDRTARSSTTRAPSAGNTPPAARGTPRAGGNAASADRRRRGPCGHQSLIAVLDRRIARADARMCKIAEADPELAKIARRLRTVPGVGPIVAATLIAELPELGRLTRRKIAALAGPVPSPVIAANVPDDAPSAAAVRSSARCCSSLRCMPLAGIPASKPSANASSKPANPPKRPSPLPPESS